jgi:GNAT superfamily N-acetyltransferase
VNVTEHTGPRAPLRALFELADDLPQQLDSYMEAGRVLVATIDGEIVGHAQVVPTGDASERELKILAVVPEHQGAGVGRTLVAAAVELARQDGCDTLSVSTAAAGTGVLRFYQRQGFRMRSIERDVFTPQTGYPPGIEIDGIELRDRVWLDRRIS